MTSNSSCTDSSSTFVFKKANRLASVPSETVWHEFTPLALEHKAVMLGQGFPSFPPPSFVSEALVAAATSEDALAHQYCRAGGHPKLVSVLLERYSKRFSRPELNMSEILVCNGTTQALNIAMMSIIDKGDEVICFEPFFDLYQNDIELAGGTCVVVGMKDDPASAANWKINTEELIQAISPATKALLINSPQNVPGKVWSLDELSHIADLAKKHNLLIISDEVYEELVYEGEHRSLATLPDMFERTITCASLGKTLSSTGWKIGWCIASKEIIAAFSQVHAHQVFSVATPLQIAAGQALKIMEESGFCDDLRSSYVKRRDFLVNALLEAGLTPVVPQGSFFVLADISGLDDRHFYDPKDESVAKDWQCCRWLTKVIGVGAIPCTAFCRSSSRHQYEKYIRFAFCKTDDALAEGAKRLLRLKEYSRK